MWLLLVPPGVEVETRTSSAVTEPLLVTVEQVQAVALTAAMMREQGLPVDVGQLLAQLGRGTPSLPASLDAAAPSYTTAPEDLRMWPCACGKTFTSGTGGEMALRRHQASCSTHAATFIPPERRVDS